MVWRIRKLKKLNKMKWDGLVKMSCPNMSCPNMGESYLANSYNVQYGYCTKSVHYHNTCTKSIEPHLLPLL